MSKHGWTPEEDAALTELWGKRRIGDIVIEMGRPAQSVSTRARFLGLRAPKGSTSRQGKRFKDRHNTKWTPEEDKLLRTLWGEVSLRTISKRLGRTQNAVQERAFNLKLGAPSQGRIALDKFRAMGYPADRVRNAITILGIVLEPTPCSSPRKAGVRPQRRLTDEQAQMVIDFLGSIPDAVPLGRNGPIYPASEWGVSGRPAVCSNHGGADVPHGADGLCRRCYSTAWARKKREKAA